MAAFKAACLFPLQKVVELNPDTAAVDTLQAFPFFTASVLADHKSELPSCLAKAADVVNFDSLGWWKAHTVDLTHWSSAASDVCFSRLLPQSNASFAPQSNIWASA